MKQIAKTILITGASSGIGEASAKLLALKGNKIILLARNEDKLRTIVKDIENKMGIASYYSIDLTNTDKVGLIAKTIIDKHGVPDVIVNSAGSGRWLSLSETSMHEFSTMIDSPLKATANTCKAFLEVMKKRNSGHIITVNSAACYFSFPGAIGYLSARWGLRGFMNALYEDLYKSKIHVSSLVAAKVDSPYFETNPGSADRIPKITNILSRTSSVDEIAIQISKLIDSPRKTLITPLSMSFLVKLNQFFPNLLSAVMRKSSYKE